MGELILCKNNLAAMPFFLENVSVNIYSLEELIYCMKKYIYLIGTDIQKDEFVSWVKQELGQQELAEKLTICLADKRSVSEFADVILESTGYCTLKEREELKRQLREYEKKSPFECKIIKADSLLLHGKYISSIEEYRHLLHYEANEETNGELLGKIWHNMGTAYARLFCFEEASACYDKAFCYNKSPITGKAYQLSEAARKKEINFSEERKEKTDGNTTLSCDIVNRVEEWKKEYEKYSRM